MILGTAGHIDHGKTTLVRALTGVDTDRLPEEKRRGITIELGFAPLVLDGVGTVGVVDVPGHEAFVRTMVAGATGIDLALVVVAADEGVMPQTREHLEILELLGVRRGCIALTKCDLVDADWLALVEEDVRAAASRVLPDARVIATSSTTGQGIAELKSALAEQARSVPRRDEQDLFRMPVDRAFTIKGTGTVVTGTVWSGALRRDDAVRVLPGDRSARVRGIQSHGAQVDTALPGTRSAIALAGLEVSDVPRGSTLVTDPRWHVSTLARADVTVAPGAEELIRPRRWFRFHVGTSEVGARVVTTERVIEPGRPIAARIMLDEPVALRAGDRFVLRGSAPVNTVGGGVITDPYAPRRAHPWPVGAPPAARLRLMIDEAGAHGVELSSLPVRLGLSAADCRTAAKDAGDHGLVIGDRVVSRASFQDLQAALVAAAKSHHGTSPLEAGVPLQLVRSRLRAPVEVIDAAVRAKVDDGTLQVLGSALAVAGWSPTPTGEHAALLDQVLSTLVAADAEPPTVDELSAQLGRDPEPVLRFLERQQRVVQVEHGRFYESAALDRLIEKLKKGMTGGREFTPAELRDVLGFSRKFLIPVLEYCDRRGLTQRGATGRVWRGG
ncbi:MAG TPA: selenocysteine-specific translation elongation factor [Gemmatimonadaceae bacterium]